MEKLKNTLKEHESLVNQFINVYKETHGHIRMENKMKKKYCDTKTDYSIHTSRIFDKDRSTWWTEKSRYHSIIWESLDFKT